MTTPEFVDPTVDPYAADVDDGATDLDPAILLQELQEGLYELAVTAERLARRLSREDVRLDRNERSGLETCRDNASAIVVSLDRVL